MEQDLSGSSAIVTGGGTGIGRAAAEALAARGCLVTVAGRTMSTLKEAVEIITAAGGQARAVQCDVTDEGSVRDAVAIAAENGRLDFGVNSAGISGGDNLKSWPTMRPTSSTR